MPSERSIKAAAEAGYSNSPVPFKDVYVITGPLFLPSKEPAAPLTSHGEVALAVRLFVWGADLVVGGSCI